MHFNLLSTNGILSQDSQHLIEVFAPFPVTVSDALRHLPSIDAQHVSGSLDTLYGYAWVVMNDANFKAQKRLFVWNYQQGGGAVGKARPGASNEVFQLSMPGAGSDQSSKSGLISIVSHSEGRSVGLVALSELGQLRYWPRIAESQRCTESSISLHPHEQCHSLRALHEAGLYILATTSGRLIQLSFQGTHNVLQKELRAPSSMLRTVGSWLGFGGSKKYQEDTQAQLAGLRLTPLVDGAVGVFALKSDFLSLWRYPTDATPESLIYQGNIISLFENALYEAQEEQLGGRIMLDFALCDFQVRAAPNPRESTYAVLLIGSIPSEEQPTDVSAIIGQRGENWEYHLATFEVSFTVPAVRIRLASVALLPDPISFTQDIPSLTVPSEEAVAYVSWEQFAIAIPLLDTEHVSETLDVTKNATHGVFGTGFTSNAALYFTPAFGIVRVKLLEHTKRQSIADHSNRPSTQAAGFMAHASAEDILSEAFHRYMLEPSNDDEGSPRAATYSWTSLVDLLWKHNYQDAVRSFALRIADSKPSEDPRWPDFAGRALDAPYNSQLQVLLQQQIEEKQDIHANFVQFLVEVGLFHELSLQTRDLLETLGEKLASAALLRSKQNELLSQQQTQNTSSSSGSKAMASVSSTFNQAMESALAARGVSRTQWQREGLGAQDVFFSQTSCIESILEPALTVLKSQLATQLSVESQYAFLTQTNYILQSIFSAALEYRKHHALQFYDWEHNEEHSFPAEYTRAFALLQLQPTESALFGPTWTRACQALLRDAIRLTRQFITQIQESKATASSRALGKTFNSALDVDLEVLHNQLFHLSDALLADWQQELIRCQEASDIVDMKSQFSSSLKELIEPFKADPSLYEQALTLAERYFEFSSMIEICQLTDDDKRLWRYAEQYKEDQFARAAFEYFFVHQQYYKLLSAPHQYWPELTEYLNDTPQAKFFAWVHHIQTEDFVKAMETFDELAQSETQSALRQTTLLSLAKLSQIASYSESDEIVLDEERQERLDLRMAQSYVRGLLDLADEDVPPASSQSVINRFLEAVDGNTVVEPDSCIALALDAYRHTTRLRSEIGNREQLETIWTKVLASEQWPELSSAHQRGEIDDDSLRENIEGSLFFRAALCIQDAAELPLSTFVDVLRNFGFDAATLRVLSDAFTMIYRAKGLPIPDLTPVRKLAVVEPAPEEELSVEAQVEQVEPSTAMEESDPAEPLFGTNDQPSEDQVEVETMDEDAE